MAAAITVAAISTIALAPAGASSERTAVCDLSPAKELIREATADRRWHHRDPIGEKTSQALEAFEDCLLDSDRRELNVYRHDRIDRFRTYRAYRRIAPVRGFSGEGRFLEWLPIPRYIVACESAGHSGEGRWTAQNPSSSANGPAQVLDIHGAPRNPQSDTERLAYWRVVRTIWTRDGAQAWECA